VGTRSLHRRLEYEKQTLAKARIAARIRVKSRKKSQNVRDRLLARWQADQHGVTNRSNAAGVAYVVAPIRLINHEWIYCPLVA
jgi:hypothetical protein